MTQRRPRWLRKLGLLVVSPLVFLTVLELAAWAGSVTPRSEDQDYKTARQFKVCQLGGGADEFCDPQKLGGKEERRSVVVLGGSSVFGYPAGERAFPHYLQSELDASRPGELAVYNLGLFCKDSIFVRRCAERIIEAQPDVLVVYTGHNDYANFMVPYPPAKMFLERHPWLIDLEHWLAQRRSYSLLYRLRARLDEPVPLAWRRLPERQFESAKRTVLAELTRNLTAIIELAGARDVPLILLTVVSNLHEHPYRKAAWDEATAPGRNPAEWERWRSHFAAGVEHYRSGRFEEALADFKLARDHLMMGRAPSVVNDRVRELSGAHAHVHLVDFERELDRIGAEPGIGCNFFGGDSWCDQFHPNRRTHRLIARAVNRKILQLEESGWVGQPASERSFEDDFAGAPPGDESELRSAPTYRLKLAVRLARLTSPIR